MLHTLCSASNRLRERKKEVVFSLSPLISHYPSVTKEDNRTKDDVKKFSRQRIIDRSLSHDVTAVKFVYKTMNRRPCLCTPKNAVGFELWLVKTFFYSKQFAKLLTLWLKTIYSSLEGVNKNQTRTRLMGLIKKKTTTPLAFPPIFWICIVSWCLKSSRRKLYNRRNCTMVMQTFGGKTVLLNRGCLIDRFQSRGQQQLLCKLLGIKESLNMWKEFNSHRIFFCTQTWPPIHCFVHKYGRRDVMWKRSIEVLTTPHIIGFTTFWLAHRMRVVNSWPLL